MRCKKKSYLLTVELVGPPEFECQIPNADQPQQEPANAETQQQPSHHAALLLSHDVTSEVVLCGIHGQGSVIWNNVIGLMASVMFGRYRKVQLSQRIKRKAFIHTG